MSYKHFGAYIASFTSFDDHLALTIRPFLKIERLSYKALRERAYQTAHYLLAEGVKPGDRVAVVASNSPQWIELFLGCQLIGAALVPIDAGNTFVTTLRFITETNPTLIFRSGHLHPDLSKHATIYVLDDLNEAIAKYPREAPKHTLSGEEMALIVFTSGTTADPKGVALTQKNILTNIASIQQRIAIDADWRLLSVLPLSHMYELTGSLAVLSSGASIFYIPRVTPSAIARALQDYRITTILAIPQLLVLLLERIQQTAADEGKARMLATALKVAGLLPFSTRRLLFGSVHSRLGGHLKLIVTGGAPIPVEVASSWEHMGVKMVQGYGLTETSPILTVNGLHERRLDSPGKPLDNISLRIAEDNEIQAKGPNVFSGYWHNPEATQAAFTADGWFRTGDVGRLQNGWLHIQGRLKFAVVLSSGLKVFPEDIELVAAQHPIFQALCIVGITQPAGEAVAAVIISDKSDTQITEAIAEINAQLEPFQHIATWHRWPDSDFPRTRLLKVDRRKVQDWANQSSQAKQPQSEAKPAEADSLIDLIRLSLGEPKAAVTETDQLADIGLDSLRRLTLVALVEERLGVIVPEEHVTAAATVADVRILLSQGSPTEPPRSLPKWPFQRVIRLIGNGVRDTLMHAIVSIWVHSSIEGQEHLQNLTRPAIFIFNHADDFDAPVVYQAIPRHIRKHVAVAMADDVMHDHKVLAFIARLCFAAFNFSRTEPYMPSMAYLSQLIDQGWSIVLSPEGSVSVTDELQEFKSGVGLLAVELGVPIVPIKTFGLHGTVPLHAKWPKKHSRVTIRVGQPITFGPNEDYDTVTEKLHHIMETL